MKKALIIFALIALTVSAFAATGDKLEITANIKAVKPEFIMRGSVDSAATATSTKATSTNSPTLTSSTDISENPITVYVNVYQNTMAKYKNNFDLTVTATNLTASGVSAVSSVSCTDCTKTFTDTDRLTVTASKTGAVAKFTLNYLDGRPVNPNESEMAIGTATFTWAKNADMPAGTYNASITLGYSAP